MLEVRGFRGGSEEKIRRMWLGRENVVVKIIFLQVLARLF